MDAMVDSRSGRVRAVVSARNQTAAFRRRDQRLVCRSSDEERILSLRSDQLSRPAPFLRFVGVAEPIWAKCVGAATSGGARQHRLRLVDIEIRAAGGKNG